MSNTPPAVFAKATTVRTIPRGEERSRLNSNVLPSGRLSVARRSISAGARVAQAPATFEDGQPAIYSEVVGSELASE